MKILGAKVIVCSPGRNFVTLKVETDQGIYGLGDATLNGRELAVASYLEDHLVPCLIGRDPFQTEDIWHYFYRGAYWRRGPVTMTAIAAIDMALWDIKGKALGVPVYNLLGGKSRTRVMVYAHATGHDIPATIDEVEKYRALGYLAIRAQSGVPGLKSTYGVAKDQKYYEPAERGLPSESLWSTEKYLRHVPKLFEALRNTLGDDLHLLHDVHHRLTPIEAARLGKELEPYHLFWLEDPVAAELQDGFRLIRKHTTTPLAVGEVFNTIWDAEQLIREQLIDYLRMSVVHGGGLTAMKKAADFAALYHVQRVAMERVTCRRCAWPRRCIWISPSIISVYRSTCCITPRRRRRSRMLISSRMALCIPGMWLVLVSILRKTSRRAFPTSELTCRSTGKKMERCFTGDGSAFAWNGRPMKESSKRLNAKFGCKQGEC
ncbi:MAG: mannonate dehydratase [Acidobacteriaceae bacterium]|nr:mannonate dehydratase [Acidobacteriaceae bacterium]